MPSLPVMVLPLLAFAGGMAGLILLKMLGNVLPVSMLLGATLMLLADVLARALAFPGDLPAGAVLALIGSPCFVWLVRRRG